MYINVKYRLGRPYGDVFDQEESKTERDQIQHLRKNIYHTYRQEFQYSPLRKGSNHMPPKYSDPISEAKGTEGRFRTENKRVFTSSQKNDFYVSDEEEDNKKGNRQKVSREQTPSLPQIHSSMHDQRSREKTVRYQEDNSEEGFETNFEMKLLQKKAFDAWKQVVERKATLKCFLRNKRKNQLRNMFDQWSMAYWRSNELRRMREERNERILKRTFEAWKYRHSHPKLKVALQSSCDTIERIESIIQLYDLKYAWYKWAHMPHERMNMVQKVQKLVRSMRRKLK